MKKLEFFKRVTACVLVFLLTMPFAAISQQVEGTTAVQNPEQVFRPEELDQILAPIALYPDALLAQVFTAATYPLDIVAADRFVKNNPGLKGEALMDAAKDNDWSPSVKAMLQFPDVLAMMDNQLDWTTKLGDAFLAQQRDVMDSVQRLRQRAYAQGKLNTNAQEVVTTDPQTQIIIIEQSTPDVVYVPVYDPLDVYGVWWYPDYPPYYCHYPGYTGGAFLVEVFVGAVWGWRSWACDWHHHGVFINVNNFNNFTRHSFTRFEPFHIDRNAGGNIAWEHNPQFRRSTGYRDYWTAQRFGGQQVSNPVVRPSTSAFRGREQVTTMTSAPMSRTENKEGVKPFTSRTEFKGNTVKQVVTQPSRNVSRVSTISQKVVTPSAREVNRGRESFSVFNGAGSGGSERAASFRGHSSFQSTRTSGSSSGVSRGGGSGRRER